MMEFIIGCRGDADTIGAMAGALCGIVHGAERLPQVRLEARELLVDVAIERSGGTSPIVLDRNV